MVRPFPVDPVITAIAIGYRNQTADLIADAVMPRIPVLGEKYKWTEYPIAERFTVPDTRVGRRGRVERVEFSGVERTGAVEDYGLEDAIPNSDIREAEAQRKANLGIIDPENLAAEGLTDLIVLDREVRVATVVQDPNNYAATRRRVLSGTAQFSDYVNSDPIGVIKACFQGTLIHRPNTVSMSRDSWTVLSSHPHLVNAVKGNTTGRGIISPDDFVRLFSGEGCKRLLIGESFVNTARRGQVENISRVWGKSIQFHYTNPQVRPEQGGITWGFTAQYGTRIGGKWDDKNVGLEGGVVVRVGERVQEQVVAKDVGYLLQNVIA
ncbi:capsid protein [Methylobacterium sp. SyP6R]|uniref:capsid protein n=1 Tax=Methylobacterium sp. SyP6R TaxID=2718876 RepID=UPI001F40C010|nr:capsid protein [Methylobacterium sp. SyP6R]MCF4125038.1 capsid protein [Methylobacterium sp. SyP6R]